MKSSLEQQLKQQLEQSSPEDLGFKPDRERMWHRIAAQQQKKTLLFRPWLTHAAAIAAGLVIGSFFLARYQEDAGQKQVVPAVAVHTPQQQAGAVMQQPAGQLQPAKPVTAALQHNPVTKSAVQPAHAWVASPSAAGQNTTLPQPIAAAPQQPVTATAQPLPEPLVAAKEQPRVKVLHLMDINNENTRAMQQPEAQRTVWAWMAPPGASPGGNSFSAQVGQIFNDKK